MNSALAQFIAEQQLTMSATPSPINPGMNDQKWEADHWRVTIKSPIGHLETYYSKGKGLRKLKQDAPSFEEWSKRTEARTLKAASRDTYDTIYKYAAEPTLAEVIDCLASDAAGVENATSFENWCSEYGYDTDSRKALATFNIVEEQAAALAALFPDQETFHALLFEIERD